VPQSHNIMAPCIFVVIPWPATENVLWQDELPTDIKDQLVASTMTVKLQLTVAKEQQASIQLAMLKDCEEHGMQMFNQHQTDPTAGFLSAWGTLNHPWPECLKDANPSSSAAPVHLNLLQQDGLASLGLINFMLAGMALLNSQPSPKDIRGRTSTRKRRWLAMESNLSRLQRSVNETGAAGSSQSNLHNRPTIPIGLTWGLSNFFENYDKQLSEDEQCWPSGINFLLEPAPAMYGSTVRPGFENPERQLHAVLNFLPHHMRQHILEGLPGMQVLCGMVGQLARRPEKTKSKLKVDRLYINQGQLDNCNYQPASFKTHLVWLIKVEDMRETAVDSASMWAAGHLRVVHSQSMNRSRLSIVPRLPDEFFEPEGDQAEPAAAALRPERRFFGEFLIIFLMEIHDFLFTHSCLGEAYKLHLPKIHSTEAESEIGASLATPCRMYFGLQLQSTTVPFDALSDLLSSHPQALRGVKLSDEQHAAVSGVLSHPLTIVDCIAGSGKTLVLTAVAKLLINFVEERAVPGEKKKLIVLAVVNKSMVEPLRRRLLGMGVSSDAAACAGVFMPSDKAYPTDMLAEWLQERTQQLLAESEDLISQAHALIRQQAADLASSWTGSNSWSSGIIVGMSWQKLTPCCMFTLTRFFTRPNRQNRKLV